MIIDLHCDTIEKAKDEGLNLDNISLSFNTRYVQKPHIQCLATFVDSKYDKEKNGFKRANDIIDNFYKIYNPQGIFIIKNREDLESDELKKRIGVILTIENGTAISGDLYNIDKLYQKGIRMMGVVWNDDNDLACGAKTKDDKGLSDLGIQYVKELEKKNIIIDVSHMSKKSFYDTINNTSVPIVASHSCVQSLCHHPRNLDDEQIKLIAKSQGVIGICFCNKFLRTEGKATSKDIVNHIDYIVNMVGINHIAFGSDFDGLGEEYIVEDVRGVKDFVNIINELKNRGYSKEEIDKICYKNFLRVANEVL